MGRRMLRIAAAVAIGSGAFAFKKPMSQSMAMAQATVTVQEQGKQAGELLVGLINTGRGNREIFIGLFTPENVKNKEFRDAFGDALGGLRSKFNDVFDKDLYSRFQNTGGGVMWDEFARIRERIKATPTLAVIVPGEAITDAEAFAKRLRQGAPDIADVLIAMGVVGPEGKEIGGDYTTEQAGEKPERKRVELLQHLYRAMRKDPGFQELFEELKGRNGKFNETFTEMVTQMETYLAYHLRLYVNNAEANAFRVALETAGVIEKRGGKIAVENGIPKGWRKDGVLDERMAKALAIYFMVQNDTWKHEVEAGFLTKLSEAVREKVTERSNAAPAPIGEDAWAPRPQFDPRSLPPAFRRKKPEEEKLPEPKRYKIKPDEVEW